MVSKGLGVLIFFNTLHLIEFEKRKNINDFQAAVRLSENQSEIVNELKEINAYIADLPIVIVSSSSSSSKTPN